MQDARRAQGALLHQEPCPHQRPARRGAQDGAAHLVLGIPDGRAAPVVECRPPAKTGVVAQTDLGLHAPIGDADRDRSAGRKAKTLRCRPSSVLFSLVRDDGDVNRSIDVTIALLGVLNDAVLADRVLTMGWEPHVESSLARLGFCTQEK